MWLSAERTCGCESLLHARDLALQGVILVRERVHPLLQLAAVLLPQRDLRDRDAIVLAWDRD
jgi:hypothetical protein